MHTFFVTGYLQNESHVLNYRKMTLEIVKPSRPELLDHPLASLPREDLALITELVLQSGSLKDLAAAYGVSYPTIRARLDKVIERLKQAKAHRKPDPVNELLARLVERAELAPATARQIQDVVRLALQQLSHGYLP
jgi:hypothetical protein